MSDETSAGVVRRADGPARQKIGAATNTEMQVLLGEQDRVPHFAMRRFIMGEAGGMPRHTNTVEHEQYVLCGRARVSIGNDVHEVEAGTVVYIPAGVPHDYQVLEAPFEFLCLVPNKDDVVELCD